MAVLLYELTILKLYHEVSYLGDLKKEQEGSGLGAWKVSGEQKGLPMCKKKGRCEKGSNSKPLTGKITKEFGPYHYPTSLSDL